VISLGAHHAVGGALALVPQQKLREVVAIALNEPPPKEEKKEPPKPPEHAPERQARAPSHVARQAPVAEASPGPAAADAPVFRDLGGVALDSSSSDGLAIRVAAPAPVAPAPVAPKLLVAHKREAQCEESTTIARPLSLVRPSYTEEARRARVQGRVRIELAINDRGEVEEARVLDGLGYGLDEAALDAARHLRFSPAMRCSKPIAAPFVIAMRFVLGT
jgi:protein TonB